MDLDRKNYYEVLEVEPSASQQEIQQAYNRSKNAYSGDSIALYSLMTKDECDAMLSQVEEAYSILSIPEKRREYDRVRGINTTPKSQPQDLTQQTMQETHRPSQKAQDFSFNDRSIDDQRREQYQESSQYLKFGDEAPRNDISVAKVSAYKKYALDFETDNDFEQEIETRSDFTGEFLKKVREYKNVSVERMAEMTKISKTHIRYIEENNWDRLPAQVYTRGFVFQYAKCLKLNPELVATSYLHNLKRLQNEP